MATNWLVDIQGLEWTMKKTPHFSTLIETSASGLEARQAEMLLTRREWSLSYATLQQTLQQDLRGNQLSVTQHAVDALEGFYIGQLGPLTSFFFRDQFFNTVIQGFIATGDGTTTSFQAQRFMVAGSAEAGSGSSVPEPVFCFDQRGSYSYGPYTRGAGLSPQAYVSGSPVSAMFNPETGVITLASASGTSGHPITATFSYGFRVRFSEDSIDFDNVFSYLHELKALKLISTRV